MNTYSAKKRLEMQQNGSSMISSGNKFALSFSSSAKNSAINKTPKLASGNSRVYDHVQESRIFRMSMLGFLRSEIMTATKQCDWSNRYSVLHTIGTNGSYSNLNRMLNDFSVLLILLQTSHNIDASLICTDFENDSSEELFEMLPLIQLGLILYDINNRNSLTS